MPKEIRKIRPECPGELAGICWKLMQKDPKFRYASAAQTAEVLEAWLAKQKVLQTDDGRGGTGGSGSSLNLGDEHERQRSSGSKGGSSFSAAIDTVSNRDNDTLSGKSGTLSPTSAPPIVACWFASPKTPALQIPVARSISSPEIARRSQLRSGHSSAHGGSTVVRTTPSAPLPGQPVAPAPAPLPDATVPRVLWVIGLAIMFVIAVLLGVLIARLTA